MLNDITKIRQNYPIHETYVTSPKKTSEEVSADLGFESYLQEQTQVCNTEESNIQIKMIAGIDSDGNPVYFPKEIENQLNYLQAKFVETKDSKYMFMQTELILQYTAYQNGEDIDSMFVVNGDGEFRWSVYNESSLSISDNVNIEAFTTKMIEVFTQKLADTKSNDLQETYSNLIDHYKTFNKANTDLTQQNSFYA